ncbi:response regulator transcription factor [Naumannella halotolerans]|uniref:DNA-binding response OmpR family regulator n=1 Tax=Naumannella halotolerans TaxID=993414 RepID=A0A4R7J4D4_9ACTN|nr:response regulator transcription factor [Naumannella halotolerans]TDT31229.1 DNA-binding response OmpR family regulator [Naumannella halotolerans]
MHILIVEDDRSVSGALAEVLAAHFHQPEVVSRGEDALRRHRDADLMLLDLGLGDLDGLTVLQRIRRVSPIPTIVITARGDERSTVTGLRSGADDYLVKPVRIQELLARIDLVARRSRVTSSPQRVLAQDVEIALDSREVRVGSDPVHLTQTEFDLLALLARNTGRPVRRELILSEVWDDQLGTSSRSLDAHMAQLRAKLKRPGLISTVRGFGYKLVD